MYYLIYKITNNVNNKIYVGKHKTENKNDGYMGSGTILNRAIEKYGIDKFTKEILFECDNEVEMNQKEAEIVDEEFVARLDTYNVKLGGQGGWDFCNNNTVMQSEKSKKAWIKYGKSHPLINKHKQYLNSLTEEEWQEYKNKITNSLKLFYQTHDSPFKGKKHTDKSKAKIGRANSIIQKGKNNSNYGKCWIFNEKLKENKSIRKEELQLWLDKGWLKGRKIKF